MTQFSGLILTVGMSHEPVIYSIQQAAAQHVGLICTPDSEKETLNRILAAVHLPPANWRKYVVADDPQHIGKLCLELYSAFRWLTDDCGLKPAQIASDPTAGRKWMSAGATMIAAHLGLTMHYVDVRYPGGKLDPASMKLIELGNAYDQTGFVAAEKGRSFFNHCSFATASEVFAGIRPSISLQADLYDGLAQLARAIDRWERFEHYQASLKQDFEQALERLRRHLGSLSTTHPALKSFFDKTADLAQAIEELHGGPRPASGFIVDVFANAQRRRAQHAHDDACGRLYRTLEALGQYCLHRDFGLDSAKPDYTRLSPEQQEAIKQLCGQLPTQIALDVGFKVLKALKHRVGEQVVAGKQNYNKFSDLLEARNRSILAHGFVPIKEDVVRKFSDKLEALLQEALGDEFASWRPRLQVPEMPSLLG